MFAHTPEHAFASNTHTHTRMCAVYGAATHRTRARNACACTRASIFNPIGAATAQWKAVVHTRTALRGARCNLHMGLFMILYRRRCADAAAHGVHA